MNTTGTRQEIVDELSRLIQVSGDLREAMLARDPSRIQQVVAEGEALGPSPALKAATPDLLGDQQIEQLARRLRRVQESNRLIANTFLKLYRQIFQPRHDGAHGDPGLYGRNGRMEQSAPGPLLIRQTG